MLDHLCKSIKYTIYKQSDLEIVVVTLGSIVVVLLLAIIGGAYWIYRSKYNGDYHRHDALEMRDIEHQE